MCITSTILVKRVGILTSANEHLTLHKVQVKLLGMSVVLQEFG